MAGTPDLWLSGGRGPTSDMSPRTTFPTEATRPAGLSKNPADGSDAGSFAILNIPFFPASCACRPDLMNDDELVMGRA
jgi:hypothetical protein